jgi:hypothetical protein
MTEKRPLQDNDVVHMTPTHPTTGAPGPADVPVTLGEIAAYILARRAAAMAAPTLDEIAAHVMSKIPAPSAAPTMDQIGEHVVSRLAAAPMAEASPAAPAAEVPT